MQDKNLVTKGLTDQEKVVAYWAVHRFEADTICKELNLTKTMVKRILAKQEVKFLIEKVRYQVYGENPGLHIRECAQKGIGVAEEIMLNKKEKSHIRQEIAFKFIHQAFGKPGIEDAVVEGSVRKILQIVTKVQNGVDLKEEKPNDIEDVNFREVPVEEVKPKPREADLVDDWIEKNI